MDKATIHQQLEILIETITEQHDAMKTSSGYLPQIDVDLFLDNIRDVYEYAIVFDKMNKHLRKNTIAKEIQPLPEPIKVEEDMATMMTKPIENNKNIVLKEKKNTAPVSVSLFDEDTISAKDLHALIGINEKYMFMNELFDGDLEAYNATLDSLDNCRDASEAEQKLFLEFQPKYQWNMNSNAIKDLMMLFNKRFS